MDALISFALARAQTKAPFDEQSDPDGAAELNRMRVQATAICMNYIEREPEDQSPAWTAATDPTTDTEFSIVQAAILRMLMHLWRWRGDDEKTPKWSPHDLPPDVTMLLRLVKAPTVE